MKEAGVKEILSENLSDFADNKTAIMSAKAQ